ncbi:MAG TPA: hypothetical protein O0X42_03050 [Methanocorpusculum sp.]|nr:hypothetical protein [Methanocorpusculum sp.]
MIREVQRIDHIEFDVEKYTASFAGITVPVSLITLTEGDDHGRKRLTVSYNHDVYVLRSHTSDIAEIKAAEKCIAEAVKGYAHVCKARDAARRKEEKESKRKSGKFAQMKQQMTAAQENALRIDKRHGLVHFAGHDVSALDVRMEVAEYGGCKRMTLEYQDQIYTMDPPAQGKAFSQKLMNAKMDMLYNDYLKARERALDFTE